MPPVINRGRQVNFLTGINGVAAGGQAIANLPTNQRYHSIRLFCTTTAGAATPVTTMISSVKLIVNGIPIRDIDPANILKICQAQGYFPLLGELPLFFTEPFATAGNINEPDDVTSWDLAGQQTFSLQIGIQGGAVAPGLTGIVEFDYQRNLKPANPDGTGGLVPFLQPVTHHQFSLSAVNGVNDITTLPFTFPIRRMWIYGSSAGNVNQVELYQDGNKVWEATGTQTRQYLRGYGFRFIKTPDAMPYRNATGPADLALSALLEAESYFDSAYISDPDGRWWKALKCGQTMNLRITSGATQTLTVVQELMPGAFIS